MNVRTTALCALATSLVLGGGAALATTAAAPVAGAPPASAPPDISVDDALAHLADLQGIADANGGTRATGTPGYTASVDYVQAALDAAGYDTQRTSFSVGTRTSYNVIADWPGGDPDHVVMAGAHLDSVSAGSGMNDNGSGSSGLLATALTLAESGAAPDKHVRFAFWGAEEQGLWGSSDYVENLPAAELDKIDLYVNIDMMGSPNYGIFVYDDNPIGDPARDALTHYFDATGTHWEYVDVDGRSDHAEFLAAGIATTGLFSGGGNEPGHANVKTAAQAAYWGGTANAYFDPCYHRACDDLDNISREGLDLHLDAFAYLVWLEAGLTDVIVAPTETTTPTPTASPTSPPTPTVPPTTTAGPTTTSSPTMTTSPTTSPTTATGNLLRNGGFERGSVRWRGGEKAVAHNRKRARSGKRFAELGGTGTRGARTLAQRLSLPAGLEPVQLSLWLEVRSAEGRRAAEDRLQVQVRRQGSWRTVASYSNRDAKPGYRRHRIDLTAAFAGRSATAASTQRIRFRAIEDRGRPTTFRLDDLVLRLRTPK